MNALHLPTIVRLAGGAALADPAGSAAPQQLAPDAYHAFLQDKVEIAGVSGIDVPLEALNPWLKPHAKIAVRWMLLGGCRAVFASFGLAKTSMQIEACWQALSWLWGRGEAQARGLIVIPLGVKTDFFRDAGFMGVPLTFVRSSVECWGPGLYLTNYESFRDGKIDLSGFDVVSLDEAACLRGMGGTKTFRTAANDLAGVRFRFVATATPSPNEFIEFLAYAEVLGIMDIGQAKTRFFRRNSEKADQLTLHPHRARDFWMWVASWALIITRPSDVGCDDAGYDLPPLDVRWHEVETPPPFVEDDDLDRGGGRRPSGTSRPDAARQLEMFRADRIGVVDHARAKRATLFARVARMAEIVAEAPGDHYVLWHDLNDERDLIAQAIPDAFVIDGTTPDDVREERIVGFATGLIGKLAAKPSMFGAGCNFQHHCRRAVFAGVGFKFHDFIQALHRIWRFGQARGVRVDVIHAESERPVVEELKRRWAQHNEMVETMTAIVREYGLSAAAMAAVLTRSLGVERVEAVGGRWAPGDGSLAGRAVVGPSGPPDPTRDVLAGRAIADPAGSADPTRDGGLDGRAVVGPSRPPDPTRDVLGGAAWKLAHNDCVDELRGMPDDSIDLIVTSIPFSNLYEYSPNYADFGHTRSNAHFWQQMDFLIPELLRVLKPGRNACIHVKDRVVYGKVTGLGFETLEPFSDECRLAFRRHGFGYQGTITSVTDVVRENNQTYRLSHSVQLRDGTRHGVGVPEQIILLRKPLSDPSTGWADTPVVKRRPDYVDPDGWPVAYDRAKERAGGMKPVPQTGYSRGRWQLDAHSFWRSAGDRLLKPEEWVHEMNLGEAGKLWKAFDLDQVYDFEQHVLIGERFEAIGALPAAFFLLPPQSWSASVWTDVLQMRSLNTDAFRKGEVDHICPLPFDIVERLIEQRSMPGEVVFDPFAGLGTVPYCALKLGRRGLGVELAPHYFAAAAKNLALAEAERKPVPTLFDALDAGCFADAEEVAA